MKRTAIAAIVTAVVIGVGTTAFALAETGQFPGAKQIKTVVTAPSANGAVSAAMQGSAVASATPREVPVDPGATTGKTDVNIPGSSSRVSPNTTVVPPSSTPSVETENEGDSEREVVTPKVRDDAEESTSEDDAEGGEETEAVDKPDDQHSSESQSQEDDEIRQNGK